ncbi:MAG: hypothetical protein BWX70_02624 [Verrucomicrobia bacterium ADurb.Bin070]|nr:MAG: hypothetical protein BWX70_02624 [Verrucomicrobia bacterium ADurb.Bin070]
MRHPVEPPLAVEREEIRRRLARRCIARRLGRVKDHHRRGRGLRADAEDTRVFPVGAALVARGIVRGGGFQVAVQDERRLYPVGARVTRALNGEAHAPHALQVNVKRLGGLAGAQHAAAPQFAAVAADHELGLAVKVVVHPDLAGKADGRAGQQAEFGRNGQPQPLGIRHARDREPAGVGLAARRHKGGVQRGEPGIRPAKRVDGARRLVGSGDEPRVQPVGVVGRVAVLPRVDAQQQAGVRRDVEIDLHGPVAAAQRPALPDQAAVGDHLEDHALVGLVAGVIHAGLGDKARRAAQLHVQLGERMGRHAVGVGLSGHAQAPSVQVEIARRLFPALARLADVKLREPDLARAGSRCTDETGPTQNHECCHFHGGTLARRYVLRETKRQTPGYAGAIQLP